MAPATDLSFVPPILATRRLRVLFSACLLGEAVAWDGKAYGGELLFRIANSPRVEVVKSCPENFSFGTPRAFSSMHDGDGFDVLDGKASVKTVEGEDWTSGAIAGAREMVRVAAHDQADLAVLMDMSPACGNVVVYLGHPDAKKYQAGPGVAAAALRRVGLPILTARDYASLHALVHLLDPSFTPDPAAFDHVDNPWYREHFGKK